MAQIIKPDVFSFNRLYESYRLHNSPAIFLAGSIEIGLAENWQDRIIDFFQKEKVIFFNPRRDDWDSSWVDTSAQFNEQVNWEIGNRITHSIQKV